jgi:tetratricopeptide (TPR) repeat protein
MSRVLERASRSLWGFLLLVASAAAADVLVLRDGRVLEGQIVDVKKGEIVFRYQEEGVPIEAGFPQEKITPHSWYQVVRSRLDAQDARGHLELARFCLKEGLHYLARKEAERARELDPSLGPEVEALLKSIEEEAPRMLLERGREALGKGKTDEGWGYLTNLVVFFPESKAAEDARKVMRSHQDEGRKKEEERRRQRSAKLDEERRRAEAEALEPLWKGLDETAAIERKAYESRNLGTSLDLFQQAAEKRREVVRKAEELAQKLDQNSGQKEELDELVKRAKHEAIQAHLSASAILVVRGNYSKALETVHQALALDPGHRLALEERARIELAAAESYWGPRRAR